VESHARPGGLGHGLGEGGISLSGSANTAGVAPLDDEEHARPMAGPPQKASFVERPHRFAVRATLGDGESRRIYPTLEGCANS
jgi:hypothetical protein